MDDKIAHASSRVHHHQDRDGATAHHRGFLFRFARDVSGLPRTEVVLLACVLLGGLWGVLAAIGIVNSPPVR